MTVHQLADNNAPCATPVYPNRRTARQAAGSRCYHCPTCYRWHPAHADPSLPPVVAVQRPTAVHRGGRHDYDWPLCLRRSETATVGRYEVTEGPVTCKRCKELP